MKKILLTGCMGQLGRALQSEYGDSVQFILTDVGSAVGDDAAYRALDIADTKQVMELVRNEKPDVIINCAAATNVDGCETDKDFAFRVNTLGPRNLAIAAESIGAKLIHISTDYVFPGTNPAPLNEFEEAGPVSAYGKTKYEGEQMVKAFSTRWFILRTAWLYGEGKNFVRTMLALAEKYEEITVVNDQIGSPTSTRELAKVIHKLEPTEQFGLYHATCEGSVSWAGFAEEIFRLAGKETKVIPVSSEEYKKKNPNSADRPAYSILDNYMLRLIGMEPMADWHEAIKEYLIP